MSEYLRRIDRSIDDLRQLLDALAAELDERAARLNAPVVLDMQVCKESLQAFDALLPVLEAARDVVAQPERSARGLDELAPPRTLSER